MRQNLPTPNPVRALAADPRHFQLVVLTGLLTYGLLQLDFGLSPARIAVAVGAAVLTQWLASALLVRPAPNGQAPRTRVPQRTGPPAPTGPAPRTRARWSEPLRRPSTALPDLRSPLITSLSLCLLLRTDSLWIAAAASALAIGSKYLIRARGKHLFNPANLGIAVFTLSTSQAWVSPGQWGSVALLGFALAGLGGLVVYRAARSDVTYAFLAGYIGFLFARAAWLGDPWAIPIHQVSSGALLLFAFFMISDPKTTPNSRAGRIAHGLLVAAVALVLRFGYQEPDGLLWSLFFVSPLVPIWDRVFGGALYQWRTPRTPVSLPKGAPMTRKPRFLVPTTVLLGLCLLAETASAFCGFYVAKADAQLFNRASQVVLVRDGDRTVITMASDYQGEPEEFALVVPVPTVLQKEQVHVTNQSLVDHLDAYTSPRLVEYFDDDPCSVGRRERLLGLSARMDEAAAPSVADLEEKDLGVTIEAKYTVGEYDILILSAEQSGGLETWLVRNGYRIPDGATRVLGSYIRQGMKFFVAKVNLEQKSELGFQNLRPIQVAFESSKFMLPLRLGTVNAAGPQEMFVYALTRTGRVESVNYRTVRLPSDLEIPTYVKEDFGGFYTSMFTRQWEKEGRNVVFLEYAWDMNWCDPCAADPLSTAQLRELGVYWVGGGVGSGDGWSGNPGSRPRSVMPPQQAQDVYVTRLHVRYDARSFPEDLVFRETGNRENFQGRYILRHPWTGEARCSEARGYFEQVAERQEREAETLASLTGWELADIHRDMEIPHRPAGSSGPWWKSIWK